MEIKLIATIHQYDYTETAEKLVDISLDDNISTVCYNIGTTGMGLTFNSYYPLCDDIMFSYCYFPYIIINNVIEWNVPYSEVTVSQFLDTHPDAKTKGIIFEQHPEGAGGPDWNSSLDMLILWAPLIWKTAVMVGEAYGIFKSTKNIISWFENKFGNKENTPYPKSITSLIYSRNIWNHHELAILFKIESEEAKNFLKAYGYKWTPNIQAYMVDEKTKTQLLEEERKLIYYSNY